VSWAAHELESYFLQKHVKVKVSYVAVLLGCLLPDLFTKLPVYGVHIGSMTFITSVVSMSATGILPKIGEA